MGYKKTILLIFVAITFLSLTTNSAYANTYSFSASCTNTDGGNVAIGIAQLDVDVTNLGGGQVLFTFTNSGPAASSITDIYFDDGTLLAIASIINGPGVSFAQGASPPDLPGGNNCPGSPFVTTAGFDVDSNPPAQPNGVNPGETVGISFTLQAGKTFADVINDLNSGALRIGIHVQGFANQGSESFINNPNQDPDPCDGIDNNNNGIIDEGVIGTDDDNDGTIDDANEACDSTPPSEITVISGMKYEDLNGDGTKDLGEPGIEDWDISLNCNDAAFDDTTSTDVDGNYEFSFDLSSTISCTITEETKSGWTNTTPTSIGPFDVVPGQTYPGKDFGNFEDVTIMGEKWEDVNGNGVDNTDPRLGDWEIFLDFNNDGEYDTLAGDLTTMTADGTGSDPLGKYAFGPLGPTYAGNRQICEKLQPGWTNTHPGSLCIPIVISSGNDLGATLPDDDTDFGNVEPIEVVKTWTYTDYNWDEICIIVEDPSGTFTNVCRPANINNDGSPSDPNDPNSLPLPDDDVLADPLPNPSGKYEVLANLQFNKKSGIYTFQNTNPGAFFALTVVDVILDIDSLTVWEDYTDCTVSTSMLQLLSPTEKPENAVKAAIAAPNGDVTEITGSVVVSFGPMGAHIEIPGPIEGGSKVYALVKFQDKLNGKVVPDGIVDLMCDNTESAEAMIGDDTFSDEASASLRIKNK